MNNKQTKKAIFIQIFYIIHDLDTNLVYRMP